MTDSSKMVRKRASLARRAAVRSTTRRSSSWAWRATRSFRSAWWMAMARLLAISRTTSTCSGIRPPGSAIPRFSEPMRRPWAMRGTFM